MGNYVSDKKNTKHYGLKLCNSTDADIILQIEKQKNFQGYIKRLIRADIENEKRKEKSTMRIYRYIRSEMTDEDLDGFWAKYDFLSDHMTEEEIIEDIRTFRDEFGFSPEAANTYIMQRLKRVPEPAEGLNVFCLVTQTSGDCFESCFDATYEGCLKKAEMELAHSSKHDRENYESIYIAGWQFEDISEGPERAFMDAEEISDPDFVDDIYTR